MNNHRDKYNSNLCLLINSSLNSHLPIKHLKKMKSKISTISNSSIHIQAWEVGPWKPHEHQQDQVQSPASGSGQSKAQTQAGQKMDLEQPWGEGLGDFSWWEAWYDPGMCNHSPESQMYHGLNKKKHSQEVEGVDYPPVLHSSKATLGVMHPALGSPT